MPRKPEGAGDDAPPAGPPGAAVLTDVPIEQELQESYLTYALSVIVSRAIPDVRDGLKPSQRRILVAMNDLGLAPGGRYIKCAKICGDTSGNYHPHGESVIYPTLVRLAQPFAMRYPLVDGQGNFGSIDGYPAAAMRYTEARLSRFAHEMLEDSGPETVDFVPNYDERLTQPTVLPGKFPNLLVNGSSGIAVGVATSIPPHNLAEIADAAVHLIEHPEASVDDLLRFVKGPDFPTGGVICGKADVRRAYRTGRGQLVVRARVEVEETKGDRKQLVVTEIPYQLQKGALLERMRDVIVGGTITGVSDLVDESDRTGMRIVIKLSPGADENVVLNQLWKHTPLQETFSVNMIALVGSRHETLNLKQLIEHYRDHRAEVITRRTRHRLKLAEERRHELEGLLLAVDNIDEVISIIRASESPEAARGALVRRFGLSDRQAEVILAMRLSRLTGLERAKLQEEHAAVVGEIADFRAILADPALVLDIVKEDLHEMKERLSGPGRNPRRTDISDQVVDVSTEDLVAVEPMAVTISRAGYLKRMRLTAYRLRRRGGKGVVAASTRESDFTEHLAVCSTHDTLLFFSNLGRVHWQKTYELPLMGRTAAGRPIATVLKLRPEERVTSLIAVSGFGEGTLAMATASGRVKRTLLSEFANPRPSGIIAVKLDEEAKDRLVGVVLASDDDELVLTSAQGKAVRFAASDARPMGRSSAGVTGIRLKDGDEAVSLVRVEPGLDLVAISANGFAKRTEFGEYRLMRRGGQGVANMQVTERTGPVACCLAASEEDELLVITAGGMIVRTSVAEIRSTGRSVQGVRVMRPDEGDRVAAAARVPAGAESDEGAGEDEREDDDESDAEADGAGEGVVKRARAPDEGEDADAGEGDDGDDED